MSRRQQPRSRGPEPALAEDGPWLAPEEVRPGLLLFVDLPSPGLETALATGVVRGVVAPVPALAAWHAACRRHGTALLALDPADGAAGADGAHLGDAGRVATLRQQLGAHGILGAACGRSRHTAMVAGEAGADYVMFGDLGPSAAAGDGLADLVGWWNELFVIPCAAAIPPDPALAATLVAAGTDLVALGAAGLTPEAVAALASAGTAAGVER